MVVTKLKFAAKESFFHRKQISWTGLGSITNRVPLFYFLINGHSLIIVLLEQCEKFSHLENVSCDEGRLFDLVGDKNELFAQYYQKYAGPKYHKRFIKIRFTEVRVTIRQ